MRAIADIKRDLVECRTRLNALMSELEDVRQVEINTICSMFRAGKSHAEIAKDLRLPKSAVQGTLWRAGLSVKARDQIRGGGRRSRRYDQAGHLEGAPT